MRVGVRTAVAVALAPLAVFAGPVAPSPAVTRSCSEDDRFLQNVRATNVPCKAAVGVAKAWARNGACFRGEGDTLAGRVTACRVRRYRCRPSSGGAPFRVRVTCRRQNRTIRFVDAT